MKNKNDSIYIPKDLEDCFIELNKMMEEDDFVELNKTIRFDLVEEIRESKEDELHMYHHNVGRELRNSWGLWSESRLAKWFNDKGIHHADDMSAIIIDSFWRHLNEQPIQLEKQIKSYQDYWKKY